MRCDCLLWIASVGINSVPTPIAVAPDKMKLAAVCRFTPPAAINGTCGKDACRALIYRSPPTGPEGNTLTKSAPALHAVTTSVGVNAPGNTATFRLAANSMIAGFNDGAVL